MPANPQPPPAPQTLGRFQLKRMLGRGAQGTVWLGFDPLLEREVAIKQMHNLGTDAKAVQRWLGEARAVSRLSHPHIVPVFEADVDAGRAYLVFELVAGLTLDDHLRRHGALNDKIAVTLMLGVLAALGHAHAAGVIHRDLKPSNILLSGSGLPRVMDFGMAYVNHAVGQPSVPDAPGPGLLGTITYMAPEALSGDAPIPAMDVFSAGLVFYEMLTGHPAITETDPYRAIYRLAHEDLSLPSPLPHPVDDTLRAIVNRALARDLTVRYSTADALHKALSEWQTPHTESADDDANVTPGSGTLEFLLRRMRHKSDFPALSDSINRIQKISQSDDENIHSLANEILKDVALTQKLLRLVNSSYYNNAGGGSVSTVSRAVALVGFVGIRNMALSLVLMEHMQDKHNAGVLRESFFRSIMAGIVANEICIAPKDAEEAFITASFQNLGRLLTQFYLAEEAEQIRHRLATQAPKAGAASRSDPGHSAVNAPLNPPSFADEEAAASAVLGISFQKLGAGVAKTWGLPDGLTTAMRRLPADGIAHPPTLAPERLRTIASAGNEITEALLCSPETECNRQLAAISKRYDRALGLTPKRVKEAVERARLRLAELANSLRLGITPGSAAAQLLGQTTEKQLVNTPNPDPATDGFNRHQLDIIVKNDSTSSPSSAVTASNEQVESGQAAQLLASGIQDISNTLVEDNFKLHEVLRMILETLYRALAFQRVVFCLRDPRTGMLTGRLALGQDAETVAPQFQIKLGATQGSAQDLFATVCGKGVDMLIADATAPNIVNRLPPWFVQGVNAPTFLLLPLVIKAAPMGLIYADRAVAGSIMVQERELSLLRTLRNQAVMAFKHAGKG